MISRRTELRIAVTTATPEQITEARGWISDCSWSDLEDVDELSDHEVVAGVVAHYDGGWNQFLSDSLLD